MWLFQNLFSRFDSSFSTFLQSELLSPMDNSVRVVDERLRQLDERRQQILEAAHAHPQAPRQREVWWPTLITKYGTETEMFRRVGIDRRVFDMALACVSEVRLETRGRQSSIKTIRERLLFLMIFMEKGIDDLEPRVSPESRRSPSTTSRKSSLKSLARFL